MHHDKGVAAIETPRIQLASYFAQGGVTSASLKGFDYLGLWAILP